MKPVKRKKRNQKKRLSLFSKCLIVYVAVLAAISSIVLLRVHSLLLEYEAAQPERVIEKQIELMKKHAKNGTLEEVLKVTDEQAKVLGFNTFTDSYVECIKNSKLTYTIKTGAFDETSVSYYILADSKPVAEVNIKSSNPKTKMIVFSSADWTLNSIKPVIFGEDFTIPGAYTVTVNGKSIEGTADDKGNVQYSIKEFGDADVKIKDIFGNEVSAKSGGRLNDKEIKFTVPSNYTVLVDGKEVPENCYVSKEISKYQYASEYTDDMPTLLTYNICYLNKDGFTPDVQITDNLGNKVEYKTSDKLVVEQPVGIDSIPTSVSSQVNVLAFAKDWSLFMTKDLTGGRYGYDTISKNFISGSYLSQVARAWAYGIDITFTSSHTLNNPPFELEKVSNFIQYSENAFSCDVYLVKKMNIANGTKVDDILNSTIYYVKHDNTDDGVDNPKWYVVDIQEKIN